MAERELTVAEQAAIAATDWAALDAMTDDDIARQIAADPDAAPDLSDAPPETIRAPNPHRNKPPEGEVSNRLPSAPRGRRG
jgi:putative transcriptional regulator